MNSTDRVKVISIKHNDARIEILKKLLKIAWEDNDFDETQEADMLMDLLARALLYGVNKPTEQEESERMINL